jgi:hypothetical protein
MVCKEGKSTIHLAPADRLEGVPEVLDRRRMSSFRPDDGDDVEPGSLFEEAVALEKMESGEGQSALLLEGDGLGWDPLTARFDLDKDQNVALAGDQVDLPFVRPVAPGQDAEADLSKEASGLAFASIAEPAVPEGSDDRVHGEAALLTWGIPTSVSC